MSDEYEAPSVDPEAIRMGPHVESLDEEFQNVVKYTAFLKHARAVQMEHLEPGTRFWGSVCDDNTKLMGVASAARELDEVVFKTIKVRGQKLSREEFWRRTAKNHSIVYGGGMKPAHAVDEGDLPKSHDGVVAFMPGALVWRQLLPVTAIPLAPMVGGEMCMRQGDVFVRLSGEPLPDQDAPMYQRYAVMVYGRFELDRARAWWAA